MSKPTDQVNRLISAIADSNPELIMSGQDANERKILAELDRLGGLSVKDDGIQFVGTKFVLPEMYSGDYLGAAQFLEQVHYQEEREFSFSRNFKYRMWDGAAAFQRALYRVFGTVGLGVATQTFFGENPPEYRTVSISPTETIQVPWGQVSLPALKATFSLGGLRDPEYGRIFAISVEAPRKNRKRIEAFFDVIADELKTNSIYRGKAFNGADDPEFLDLSGIDESKVVYSDEVMAQLNANLWSLIEHTDTMRDLGIPLKRAVLLEGPFGTGKSLAGGITAKRAQENGWTFILARPGRDDIFEVLNTAKLYAPAVVQFEDIDTIASTGSTDHISKLLDILDGISNKSNPVVALFTTNYVERLQKGVMRPGRIDSIIRIAELDRNGTERLIRAVTAPGILGEVDFDAVYSEVKCFLPAFVKEAVDRAVRYSISRNGGKPGQIETADIVNAAIGLQRQLQLMNDAQEGRKEVPPLEEAFGALIDDRVSEQVADTIKDTLNGAFFNDADDNEHTLYIN